MKFAISSTLCAAALCFLSGELGSNSMVSAAATPNLRRLEWGGPDGGGPDGGHDGHDGPDDHGRDEGPEGDRDHDEKDREERERDEHDERDEKDREEREREEHDERDEKEREEEERREQEERERQREEDREREEGRFDCPPDRPWLCAPTTAPTLAPSAVPTLAPTFIVTTTGIFGSGVFSSGDYSQDAEIGLALGVALAFCGAIVALLVVGYRYDMHKILAMKVLRSESQGFSPRMHEHGTAIDISSRPDDSSRGSVAMTPTGHAEPEWGAAAGSEPKKSRKSRSGKTIDF